MGVRYKEMEYTIRNDYIIMTVSSRGGEPLCIRSCDGTDYLYTGNTGYWRGRAPHLFPFIGRLFEERYLYKGVSYPLSIHGFLKDTEMELEEHLDDRLVLSLTANEKTLEIYPFIFTLKIIYRLSENTVHVTFEVKNEDDKKMFFAIGGHPGFNVPLEEGLNFEDYYLEFSKEASPKRSEPTKTNLLNGVFHDFPLKEQKIVELKHNLFDDDAIILKETARAVTLKSDKGSRAVKVSFPDFKYIGFWHSVKSDAPFVCIEPWTALQGYEGIIEEIDKNSDMIILNPNEVYENEWSITIIK